MSTRRWSVRWRDGPTLFLEATDGAGGIVVMHDEAGARLYAVLARAHLDEDEIVQLRMLLSEWDGPVVFERYSSSPDGDFCRFVAAGPRRLDLTHRLH